MAVLHHTKGAAGIVAKKLMVRQAVHNPAIRHQDRPKANAQRWKGVYRVVVAAAL